MKATRRVPAPRTRNTHRVRGFLQLAAAGAEQCRAGCVSASSALVAHPVERANWPRDRVSPLVRGFFLA